MGKEAWNGAQEWMVENLEWREADELWIQVGRHQAHLLSHKQFLSASYIFRDPFSSRRNFLDLQRPSNHPSLERFQHCLSLW